MKKVVVGMSGGVDSSVAAWLLKQEGYDVIGVTMRIWQEENSWQMEENGGCCGLSAVDDARRVAQMIGIPYYVMDFREEFKREVIDYFIREYQLGRTPNPCIACNRHVKWEALLSRSLAIGADYIATGHYARVERLSNGRYAIRNSVTEHKDQTYALYNLTQEQLSHTLMPVGAYHKEEIRRIANEIGLTVAAKPDSQDICFIPGNNHAAYIEKVTGRKNEPGDFMDMKGNVIGRHEGIAKYTIGQRKGLGLPMGERVFVTRIIPETNQVVIGGPEDVYADRLIADGVNWMSVADITEPVRAVAKIRYSHGGAACTVRRLSGTRIECVFDEPVRAVTPGQAVVLYDGEYVMGGGIICREG